MYCGQAGARSCRRLTGIKLSILRLDTHLQLFLSSSKTLIILRNVFSLGKKSKTFVDYAMSALSLS